MRSLKAARLCEATLLAARRCGSNIRTIVTYGFFEATLRNTFFYLRSWLAVLAPMASTYESWLAIPSTDCLQSCLQLLRTHTHCELRSDSQSRISLKIARIPVIVMFLSAQYVLPVVLNAFHPSGTASLTSNTRFQRPKCPQSPTAASILTVSRLVGRTGHAVASRKLAQY